MKNFDSHAKTTFAFLLLHIVNARVRIDHQEPFALEESKVAEAAVFGGSRKERNMLHDPGMSQAQHPHYRKGL